MPTQLPWSEIALRLLLTVVAGTIVGLDRGEHGRPAGLRTTLLVCLSAAVSMIQTNLLLPTAGKPTGSFVTLDLMRLPLGILTGMGFIGAGAILKKDDIVTGITTAATLWFVTVLGLCFGGGQWGLGVASLVIGIGVLTRSLCSSMKALRMASSASALAIAAMIISWSSKSTVSETAPVVTLTESLKPWSPVDCEICFELSEVFQGLLGCEAECQKRSVRSHDAVLEWAFGCGTGGAGAGALVIRRVTEGIGSERVDPVRAVPAVGVTRWGENPVAVSRFLQPVLNLGPHVERMILTPASRRPAFLGYE